MNAEVLVTDSGGLQKETSALGLPSLTIRENTVRPITISNGKNTLIGSNWKLFQKCINEIREGSYLKNTTQIHYCDGKTGVRILDVLNSIS